MIDTIYKTLLTILNKENQGYVSPTEFNLLANNVQNEIFRGYFEDYNRDRNRENRGITNQGYANLAFTQRQFIQRFAVVAGNKPVITGGLCQLPPDLYMIEEDGVVTGALSPVPYRVVSEVERGKINYLRNTIAAPTNLYPVYEIFGNERVIVYPDTVAAIDIKYLRKPVMPNWTYTMVSNQPMFNPSTGSYRDFDLHEAEFSNIVVRMLSYFGITLREQEVVQIAESMKNQTNIKENN